MKVITPPVAKHGDLIRNVVVRQAGIIIYPTETQYALGCAANSEQAVSEIYKLKKRDQNQPLLVLVNSWEMLERHAAGITEKHLRALAPFWPGPLTVILKTKSKLAKELNLRDDTLALRITSSTIAQELIDICGVPLVGTSANLSGRKTIVSRRLAQKTFGDQVDLYIDGGETTAQQPSTIINMMDPEKYACVRQGAIPWPKIKSRLDSILDANYTKSSK